MNEEDLFLAASDRSLVAEQRKQDTGFDLLRPRAVFIKLLTELKMAPMKEQRDLDLNRPLVGFVRRKPGRFRTRSTGCLRRFSAWYNAQQE